MSLRDGLGYSSQMGRNLIQFAMARIDRDRVLSFLRFTLRRFIDDQCPQSAGALSYTTVFAMVPLTASVLGILAAFPVFDQWRDQITLWIFHNFVPAAGDTVQSYITQFAANASKATAIGILVLLFSALALMVSIEDAFNRIFRAKTDRRPSIRFIIYWTALSLGPLLVVAALAISSYLFALPFIGGVDIQMSFKEHLLAWLPFLIVWVTLIFAYVIIPNRPVVVRKAVFGALIAAVMFEIAKRGFALYITSFPSFERIYGAIAIVPIFILWVYLSWLIVLFGASITASMSAFAYRPRELRMRPGHDFIGLLKVLRHFVMAQARGNAVSSAELRDREPFLTDDLLDRFLKDLENAGVIQRSEVGSWLMIRNLSTLRLVDLYEAGHYRIPLDGSLDASEDLPGLGILRTGAAELATTLSAPLSAVYAPLVPAPPTLEI